MQLLPKSSDYALELTALDSTLPDISQYDTLTLKLKNTLLKILPFAIPRDPKLSLEDQIKWQINASLEKPLDQYALDFKIYKHNEQEILGLAGVIEKTILGKLTNQIKIQNNNISKITSEDDQFIFYTQNISFWKKLNFLTSLNKHLLFYCSAALASLFIFASILGITSTELQNKLELKEKSALNLIKDYRIYQEHKRLQVTEQNNRKNNQIIINSLNLLTEITPAKLYFDELAYDPAQQLFSIRGFSEKGLEEIDSFLKKSKRGGFKTALLDKTSQLLNKTTFELTLLLKDKA